MSLLKRLVSRLPVRTQEELKRIHFARQIRKDRFRTNEPEYDILDDLISPGDWVIDVGANVGHYTKRFCELVGENGRVIAFEPVPETFAILSANARYFVHPNVTLINAAASDKTDVVGMAIPNLSTGLANYYEAHLSSDSESSFSVLSVPVDSVFDSQQPIALIKIDAERHEAVVLRGMRRLIEKYHPVLIVEISSETVIADLVELGYVPTELPNSPNVLFKHDT